MSSRTIQHCKNCHTPNTRPRITFSAEGICNACTFAERKKDVDWEAKEQEFRDKVSGILERAPDRQYDCIVPVSGGKDSHYQAYFAKNILGLKALCVTFTPLMPSDLGQKNLRNLIEKVGVDHIAVNANPQVYAKLSRIMLEEHGDPFKPFLYGLFSGCAQIAVEKNIPLFFYGENGETEYGGSEDETFSKLDTEGVHARVRSDRANFLTPDQWTQYGFSEFDLRMFQEPPAEKMANIDRLFMADYVPWNNNHHLHVALNVIGGFTLSETRTCGTYTHGSGIDDELDEIYLWMTWPKFGYGRATKYASKDIREGKLTMERAKELIRLYDGEFPWHMFDRMLEVMDMHEDDFWQVVRNHIGDEENIERDWQALGRPNEPKRPVAWEKTGDDRWRLLATTHGEERLLELPLQRPDTL
jgi:N-acetyl sugar amidotransferase